MLPSSRRASWSGLITSLPTALLIALATLVSLSAAIIAWIGRNPWRDSYWNVSSVGRVPLMIYSTASGTPINAARLTPNTNAAMLGVISRGLPEAKARTASMSNAGGVTKNWRVNTLAKLAYTLTTWETGVSRLPLMSAPKISWALLGTDIEIKSSSFLVATLSCFSLSLIALSSSVLGSRRACAIILLASTWRSNSSWERVFSFVICVSVRRRPARWAIATTVWTIPMCVAFLISPKWRSIRPTVVPILDIRSIISSNLTSSPSAEYRLISSAPRRTDTLSSSIKSTLMLPLSSLTLSVVILSRSSGIVIRASWDWISSRVWGV